MSFFQGHYGNTSEADRQNSLRKVFHFDCKCSACSNHYPTAQDLPKTYSAEGSKYSGSSEVTQELKLKFDKENERMNTELFEKLNSSDLDGMIELYCQKTDMAKNVNLECPHLIYEMGKAGLCDCLWLKYGNRGQGFRQEMPAGVFK